MRPPKPATECDRSMPVGHKDPSASGCGPDGPRSTRISTLMPRGDQERPPSLCLSQVNPVRPVAKQVEIDAAMPGFHLPVYALAETLTVEELVHFHSATSAQGIG
jgi:hypothetical protein